MKDYSNFLTEKPYSCSVEGCTMKFTNEDHLAVHKKRHDMILTLGLGQKGTTFSDQTPTPTQFIRNCEEVGLFQDLQNVNPFEETFKKAVEGVKSGLLSLEKSFQSNPSDDTLHTPNVFPHITDVISFNHSDISHKSENIVPCENELMKEDNCDTDKSCLRGITSGHYNTQAALSQGKRENAIPLNIANNLKSNLLGENKVILNGPEGHLMQLLTPEDSQSSSNVVVLKNTSFDEFSPLIITVKEKLKKSLIEKKTGKNLPYKVPILKFPIKGTANSNGNKYSQFSKNTKKSVSTLEISGSGEVNEITTKQKKINKSQTKESRSEFLARSRAASSRCREKKKMYLLYLEKINSELSTANQNLKLINSFLRQEINDLRHELLKHRNCSAADKNTEAALTPKSVKEINLFNKKASSEGKKLSEVRLLSDSNSIIQDSIISQVDFVQSDDLILPESSACHCDPSLFSCDVAEVILNCEPEESEIPLNEGNKPPDIIVRFNSVSNDFQATFPFDSFIEKYIERAEDSVKQIYGEHSYYLKKATMDIDKHITNCKTFQGDAEPETITERSKKLSALQFQIQQNNTLRDLTSLNSKVLIGPRTPPPLILLKPFKKRSLQNKQNERI